MPSGTLVETSRHTYSVSPRISALATPRPQSTRHAKTKQPSSYFFFDAVDPDDDDAQPPVLTHDEERSFATHQCHGTGAIFGAPMLAAGVHTFVYEIHHSASGEGYGIKLGIADADPSPPPSEHRNAGHVKPQRVWAFAPYDGCVHTSSRVGDAWDVIKPITRKHLRGQTKGARVELRIDMRSKRLAFRVNGAAFVDAGVTLPDVVRPCITLAAPGDAVSLCATAHRDAPLAARNPGAARFLLPSDDAALMFESVAAARQQLFDAARDAAEERIQLAEADAAREVEEARSAALAEVAAANTAVENAHADARKAIEYARRQHEAASVAAADSQAATVAEAAAEATARARASFTEEKAATQASFARQLSVALAAARDESTAAIEEMRESMAQRLRQAEEGQGSLASAALERVASLEAANAAKAKIIATLEFELIGQRSAHDEAVAKVEAELTSRGDSKHIECARLRTELSLALEAVDAAEKRNHDEEAKRSAVEEELEMAYQQLARERMETERLRQEVATTWQSCLRDMQAAIAAEKVEAQAAHDDEVSQLKQMLVSYQNGDLALGQGGRPGVREEEEEDDDLDCLDEGDEQEDVDALLAWSDGLRSGVANAQPAAAASDSDGMIVQVTEEEEQAISEALADWRQRNSSGGMAPAEDDQCAQAVRAAKLAIRGKSGSPRGARSLEAALEAVMAGNGAPPADATDDDGWSVEKEAAGTSDEEVAMGDVYKNEEILEMDGLVGALRRLEAAPRRTDEEEMVHLAGEELVEMPEQPEPTTTGRRRRVRPSEGDDDDDGDATAEARERTNSSAAAANELSPARPPHAPMSSRGVLSPMARCFACPDSSELPQGNLQRCPSCRGLFHVRCFVSHKCSGKRHHSAPPSPLKGER